LSCLRRSALEIHDLAVADLEIQILDRSLAGVAFGEIFDLIILNYFHETIESTSRCQKF